MRTLRCMQVCALLFALAAAPAFAADALEQLLGAEQAKAMGLDKLTPTERDALAQWIQAQRADKPTPGAAPMGAAATAAAVAPSATLERPVPQPPAIGTVSSFGLQQDAVDGDLKELRAKVLGAFTGWEGQTLFKLDNGQVWRQAVSGSYHFVATDPDVVIEKGFLGYKLRLVATKRSIAVRRVK